MEPKKMIHFLMVPFTGLGLYKGFRGERWLRNRIQIFKQFVVPSLLNQTRRNYWLWVAWRYEERGNKQVIELERYLNEKGFKVVFTYAGIPFWDDKYPDFEANTRLLDAIHGSMPQLINVMGTEFVAHDVEEVLMTIQPSDDCYVTDMVQEHQEFFDKNKDIHVYGYQKGYVMDYTSRRIMEWNPKTTPPFYTIRFPYHTFTDPFKHAGYIGPYKSHEYVKDFLPALYQHKRGFLVGTHGENISTVFDHPYAKALGPHNPEIAILHDFGLDNTAPLRLPVSIRKWGFNKLPYAIKRKLRYWSERSMVWSAIYKFLRN